MSDYFGDAYQFRRDNETKVEEIRRTDPFAAGRLSGFLEIIGGSYFWNSGQMGDTERRWEEVRDAATLIVQAQHIAMRKTALDVTVVEFPADTGFPAVDEAVTARQAEFGFLAHRFLPMIEAVLELEKRTVSVGDDFYTVKMDIAERTGRRTVEITKLRED